MKHLRQIFLLASALLTAGFAQAQYLNLFGNPYSSWNGSIPLTKLDSVAVTPRNGAYQLVLHEGTDVVTLNPTGIDSLTVTPAPIFLNMAEYTGKAYLRITPFDGQSTTLELTPAWSQPGLYHALVYIPTDSYVEYSLDQQNWTLYSNYQGFVQTLFEGWSLIILDYRPIYYMQSLNPFYYYGNRSSQAKAGFAFVTGTATGDWTDSNPEWRMSVPVNGDGWWASPRFKADGEVRAYVKLQSYDWWKTEFTIHNDRIFWRDSDIPTSWAANVGADYSVQAKAGQKLYVNFTTGEALVSTPDEVPFPLENPVFLTTNTMNVSYDDPMLCTVGGDNGNTVELRWNAVDGASGYRIKMAYMADVSVGGAEVWSKAENLLLDKTVDANTTELIIPDLDYATDYRFAIQALSARGEQFNSAWFGYGNLSNWYAYMGLETNQRYDVPQVVSVSNITKNSVRVNFNLSIAQYDDDAKNGFRQHFNFTDDAKTLLRADYLTVTAAKTHPDAVVPERYARYALTTEDLERGYVDVEGLDENTAYLFDIVDGTIAASVDASYNTVERTTKGSPGAPIVLKHATLKAEAEGQMLSDYNELRADVFALAADYDAAPLSPTLKNFMTSPTLAEGQVFYLEGGKTYYLDGQDVIYRGFTLATLPEDVAAGKRAQVICGIGTSATVFIQGTNGEQWNGTPYAMFMLGRQQDPGGDDMLEMETLAFRNIDFDNPKAFNYGDNQAGRGSTTGNYFANMYSNGMGITLDSLVMENCTFKRFVRGFIRDQGMNAKVWNHVLIKNNQFLDCGYYSQGAGGYAWIAGAGQNTLSNLYKDMQVVENTFFDSPFPAFISEERELDWVAGTVWNITFSNNTLINFNTRANGAVFKMRGLPGGSVYNVKNNLLVLCKQQGDQRALQMWGADIRNTQAQPDGSLGHVTLNFENNWSTNNDLTNGQIFSSNAWTATSNNFGKLVRDGHATLNGTLEVQVADISATELMEQPCPPHVAQAANDTDMHRADALDGTATTEYNVNLYFKSTDNDIVRNKVGASRWYQK